MVDRLEQDRPTFRQPLGHCRPRDEVARHRAANHSFGKIKALAARARPHGDLDVAELTMAARLLFITGVLFNRFGNGPTVGGLRRRCVDGCMKTIDETCQNRLQLRAALPFQGQF